MKKIIIIGSGPAGISAALYTARAGIDTMVIARDAGALQKAEQIENYYGIGAPLSGSELHARGLKQAEALGVPCIQDEVFGVSLLADNRFSVTTATKTYEADAVLLATGAGRRAPAIPGLAEFETKGVSYCAICDAFACRGKPAAVIGDGKYALHEALALKSLASQVYILKNGAKETEEGEDLPDAAFTAEGFGVRHTGIRAITGEHRVNGVLLDDGEALSVAMVFVAIGTAGGVQLAQKLGAYIENGKIVLSPGGATTVPGFFAAGDCTGGLLQISKAVYEGMNAALSAIAFLRKK